MASRQAMMRLGAVVALAVALVGCWRPNASALGLRLGTRSDSPAQATPEPGAALAQHVLRSMSLDEKVGQLMVVSFVGATLGEDEAQTLRDLHPGGVILFQPNLTGATQTRTLIQRIQATSRIPLLIGVDQEGGPVVRVTGDDATLFPSEMALGATLSPRLAGQVAYQTATELRLLGINTNFAPVVDVNSNPNNPVIGTRSYGADPALVGRLATAAIGGAHDAGVLAVAKHFPGHGDADVDSHKALPTIAHALSRLETVELPPFRAAIAAGVDGVMTAHLLLPALEPDPQLPATLSPAVLGYLRNTLGYDGIIITDDLEMGAIVNDYGTAEAAKMAFEAGADVLLFRRNIAEQRRAQQLLLDAVRRGEISQSRLDASVQRILEAKAKRGLLAPTSASATTSAPSHATAASPTVAAGSATPPTSTATTTNQSQGATAGAALAQEVAQRSLTLVKNEGGVLPLSAAARARLCVVAPKLQALRTVEVMPPPAATSASQGASRTASIPATLGDAVTALVPTARVAAIALKPSDEDADAAATCASGASGLVLGSYNLNEYPEQADLLQRLADQAARRRVPVMVVALRLPYDLARLPGASALLATYSIRPASLQAAAAALLGPGGGGPGGGGATPAPSGHLPVPVSAAWPLGFGLQNWSTPEIATAPSETP